MKNDEITFKQLQTIPIFRELSEDRLELLGSISKIKHLQESEILFYEGDVSKYLHLVLDGSIQVYKVNKKGKEILLKEFFPFSFIAEVANFTKINFPASAKSIGNATVLRIEYEKIEESLLYDKNIASHFLKSMASKVLNLENIISKNLTMDATQRVAEFIYNNETLLKSEKHHEIALKLNITSVSFSRILKKFKNDAILDENNTLINKNLLKESFS